MTDEGLDDEGISAAVDADGNCVIHRVFSSDKLFITTNKGVFAVTESILTPTNTVPEKQTDVPCSKIRPVELNGTVVYITQTKTGIPQSVASITYSDDEKKYKTRDLAKLAYALMRRPRSFDVCKASLEKNATYLFVVNSDGTLAVLNTDDEELDGWTLCNTRNGEFLAVSVINDAPFLRQNAISAARPDILLKNGTTKQTLTCLSNWFPTSRNPSGQMMNWLFTTV